MFDFFPVGAPLAAVMVVYMCVMAKFLLPGTSSTQRQGQDSDEDAALRKSRNFFSYFKVRRPPFGRFKLCCLCRSSTHGRVRDPHQ